MTIKELKEKPELVNLMTEDLDEFSEDTEVVFEVFAFGYDNEDNLIDCSLCLASSPEPKEAIQFATELTAENVESMVEGAQRTVEVETVIGSEDECINIGTIYLKTLEN